MASAPAEILSMICMTPACVAAVRLVCANWSRLAPPRYIFRAVNSRYVILESDHYQICRAAGGATYFHSSGWVHVLSARADEYVISRAYVRHIASGEITHTASGGRSVYSDVHIEDVTGFGLEYTVRRRNLYRIHAVNFGTNTNELLLGCRCRFVGRPGARRCNAIVMDVTGFIRVRNGYDAALKVFEDSEMSTMFVHNDAKIDESWCPVHNDLVIKMRQLFSYDAAKQFIGWLKN